MRDGHGFTLVELMVTIAVLAILLAAGAPSFRELLTHSRLTGQANELLTAMHLARSESLKRARPVSLCASSDSASCGGTWQDGWIAFVDGNPAGNAAPAVDQVLRVWTGPDVTVGPNVLPAFVRFVPDGSVDAVTVPAQLTFQLRAQGCVGDRARDVVVSPSGRVVVRKANCT